ncbi:flagellar hook-associated protein FlgL [Oscillospiraceae bacterium OttesenSCG-928-G22]|nr:flagellar hook-associated protein FlgL [Oscillospiraceae bacterium OttesenSCG-928-G22]
MRVTNSMLTANFLRDLGANTERMAFYQTQMAQQKKITRLSQDPVGVVSVLKSRAKLRDLAMYRENIQTSKDWLTQSETAANDIEEVIKRMKELNIQGANDPNSDEARQSIAAEVKQLKEHLVTALNSTQTNKYLFSGYNVSETPFETTSISKTYDSGTDKERTVTFELLLFNGVPMHDVYDPESTTTPPASLLPQFTGVLDPDTTAPYASFADAQDQLNLMNPEPISYKIGFDLMMDVSVHGLDFIGTGDNNLFKIINDIERMLSGERYEDTVAWNEELNPMIQKIDDAQDRLLASIAEMGGKQNRLDLYENRYSYDAINYEEMRSNVEDLDMAEASMHFMMAEAVYKAALSVGSRVIQPTLLDFLR